MSATGSGSGESEDAADAARPRYFVRAAERTLAVISAFGADRPQLNLAELAAITGLDRATVRRVVLTLRDLGYVRQTRRDFELTPRVLELGYAYLAGVSLVDAARPRLREVAEQLDETASLTVLDGADVVYLDLIASRRIASVRITVGTRFVAHATSMGRVMLADLPPAELDAYFEQVAGHDRTELKVLPVDRLREAVQEAGRRGWAIVDEELESGLTGVAAPVRDGSGRVVAAVNVSAHHGRLDSESVRSAYVEAVRRAANEVGRDIAGART